MRRAGAAPKPTILVVDDDPGIREGLQIALTPRYRVLTADSTRAALHMFREEAVDLLIADIRMPGPDGVTLVQEIRLMDLKVPIVIVTAYPEPPKTEALATEGIAGFFRKPFNLALLCDRVHRLLAAPPPTPPLSTPTPPLSSKTPAARPRLAGQRGDPGAFDERVDRAMEFLANHLHRRILLDELLAAARCSHTTLTRLFRQRVGLSPMQYVARLRIQEACRLLTESDLPFTRICERVGFQHVPHAHTLFRQVTGMNPAEFRQVCREVGFESARTRIFSAPCEQARKILTVDGVYLFALQAGELIGVGAAGFHAHLAIGLRIPAGDPESMAARVVREGRTLTLPDAAAGGEGTASDARMFKAKAGIWRRLALAGEQVGLVIFASHAPRAFPPAELARVDALCRSMVRRLSFLA